MRIDKRISKLESARAGRSRKIGIVFLKNDGLVQIAGDSKQRYTRAQFDKRWPNGIVIKITEAAGK